MAAAQAACLAARSILAARRGGALIPWGAPFSSLDVAGALGVQRELRAQCSAEEETNVGWKCGATGEAIQQRLGLDGPFFGPLYAGDLLLAPALGFVEHGGEGGGMQGGLGGTVVGVEAEFTLRLGTAIDLKGREAPATASSLSTAVEAVIPSIEVCGTRFEGGLPLPEGAPALIADFAGHSALVLGTARKLAMGNNLQAIGEVAVELTINSEKIATGSAAAVLGHPLESLAWLVNALAEEGLHETLPAGALIATGATGGQHPVKPGGERISYLLFSIFV